MTRWLPISVWLVCVSIAIAYVLVGPTPTKTQTEGHKVVEVTSIYDGDTFRCNIPGWPPIIGERIPIRLARIDTPEISGEEKEEGRKAKVFTVEKLRAAKVVTISDWERGKYFRIVAEVYVDGENLNDLLLQAGLAEKWDDP